jgi:hypothetical protein
VVEGYFDRFGSLKGSVAGTASIGFATEFGANTAEHKVRQMAAQSVLAPVTLDVHDQHLLVVADFDEDSALYTYLRRVGGTLLAHPRPGLALLERSLPAP